MDRLNKGDRRCDVWIGNVGISGYSTAEHLQFAEKSRLMREVDCLILLVGVNDCCVALTRSSGFGTPPIWYRSESLYMVKEAVRRRRQRQAIETIDTTGTQIVLRRERRERAGRTERLPDLGPALADYKERLLTIAEVCRKKKVRCIFMTQPVLWDSSLSPSHERFSGSEKPITEIT